MYTHELTPKPVPTGSNHRFITTAEREREGESPAQEDEAMGGNTATTEWDTEKKSGETLEQEQERMKR